MGSHAVDSKTANAASSGAQAQDQQLAQNAAQNQAYSNQTRQNLFGNYSNGKYSGGSLSNFLDPSALNQSGLNGTYLNQYNNAANSVANQTQNAVGTTLQNLASRGMGRSPAGFAADQERRAYQTQAGQLGDLFSGAANQQHSDALNNFWNATNMLNSNASQTANLALQGNQAAAGNYANLYGTGEQQTPSGWAVAGQTLAGMGQAAAGALACWVAAELYDGWDDPRVSLVRNWIFGTFAENPIGNLLGKLYIRFGERMAKAIRINGYLRAVMQRVFDAALRNSLTELEAAMGRA